MLTVELSDTWSYGVAVRDDGNCLIVKYNDEIILEESDRVEPEDVSFCRNFKWVQNIIQKAYELGISDGANISSKET